MRSMKRILTAALLLALLLPAFPTRAAEREYTYTVRFFAGQQGSFESGDVVVFEGLKYGERVTFNQRMITLKDDSKYYIKGIRESGRDNNEAGVTSFPVTGDQDYVVAYGLRGNAVAYTIHYVDENGAALADSETYYGNVGDKPVVAYLYMEGYQPQAYNITRTLVENAADNEFTFVYTRTNVPGTPGAEGTQQPAGTEPGGAGQDGTEGTPGAEEQETLGNEGDEIGENQIPQTEPPELLDIDDDQVPLADGDKERTPIHGVMDITTRLMDLPLGAKVAIILGIVAVAGVGIWFLVFHKKRKKQ